MGMYNLTAAKLINSSVTIGGNPYNVTSYTDNGIQGTVINLTHGGGNYRGFVGKDGPRTGAMTIEAGSSSETVPSQWSTLSYSITGSAVNWVVTGVSEAYSATAAGTYNLTLQAATGSAV